MKIVIDIPEVLFDRVKNAQSVCDMHGTDIVNTFTCIQNATVLPKEHGDLIDRDTIQMSAEKFHSLGDLHTAQWIVDNAPIVIKSDRGE